MKRLVRKLDLLLPGVDFTRLMKNAINLDIVDGRKIQFTDLINEAMKAFLTALLSRAAPITVFINFASITIRSNYCFHGYIIIYRAVRKETLIRPSHNILPYSSV